MFFVRLVESLLYFIRMKINDELILHDELVRFARHRIKELTRGLTHIQADLRNAPLENLRVVHCHNSIQYHLVSDENKPNGIYVNKKMLKKAAAVAQRDYYRTVSDEIQREISAIENFLSEYHPERVQTVYQTLNVGRRKLVKNVFVSDVDFVSSWKSVTYERPAFLENSPEYFTNNGLRVRSKSEIIIANQLVRSKIPFRYEAPLTLNSEKRKVVVHPDFTCLNVRTRKEFVWEHFGMMNDENYVENALGKIHLYSANGLIQGKNFIATFETLANPLSVKIAQQYIEQFLK